MIGYERERLVRPHPDVETVAVTGAHGMHMAGPRYLRSEDESFFRPLSDLNTPDTRIYLGIVLPLDGIPGLKRRRATASKYLSDFGVAMYCGFGRQPGANGMETMREHRRVARAIRDSDMKEERNGP